MTTTSDNESTGAEGGTVLPKQTVWEDTVIIAFRDLQWHRWRLAVQKAKGAKRTELLATSPADLHKLDHNAESAFGDVLTSQDARYFLFEFKAVRDNHSDERGKGMFERLSKFDAEAATKIKQARLDQDVATEAAVQNLLDLSRRCHFGVFGQRVALSTAATTTPPPLTDLRPLMFQAIGTEAAPAAATSPGAVQLRLLADPYLEWVGLANRALATEYQKKVQAAADQQASSGLAGTAKNVVKKAAKAAKAATEKADKFLKEVLDDREVRAANLAAGPDVIARITIADIDQPIPLESIVWPKSKRTSYGVTLHELVTYLIALLDLPGPGKPPCPERGGAPGDEIQMKLVRVVDNVVVQWTITMAEVRASVRLRQLIDQRAAKGQEVQVDIDASGSPTSPPLATMHKKRKKQDGGGGTQMEMLDEDEGQG